MAKRSDMQVYQVVENEGLGYAIQSYMSGKDIANPMLAKKWDECAALLNEIEEFLNGVGNLTTDGDED